MSLLPLERDQWRAEQLALRYRQQVAIPLGQADWKSERRTHPRALARTKSMLTVKRAANGKPGPIEYVRVNHRR